MHTDEAVNALLVGEMLDGKAYAYNPRDFHGPAFYFLAEPLLRVMGVRSLAEMEAWQLRLVSALTWSALLLLLPLLRSGIGGAGVVAAGCLLLLAAPFCYFSTDFIHESLFIFATVFSIAAGWQLVQAWKIGWAAALGCGVGLMIATKETAVLTLAAAGFAFVITARRRERDEPRKIIRAMAIAAVAALLVVIGFFSSFGSHFEGLRDLVTAGANFTARAGGQGHEKPWWTYLKWVFVPAPRAFPCSGWILAGLFAAGIFFALRRPLVRFLALFTLGLWALYSAIPYKTPWLELSFLVPMALVGGAGVHELWTRDRCRPAIGVAGVVFAVLLAGETMRLCLRFSADPMNPLAYAASSNDVKRLAAKVAELLAGRESEVIQVISADSWPLPWYLRKFPKVGYWTTPPGPLTGGILIVSPEVAGAALGDFPGYRLAGIYGTRPEMLAFVFAREEKAAR